MSTDTTVRQDTTPRTSHGEPGDHERFSHFVEAAKLARAYVEGIPVRALCGKTWVPSADPERFPVCPRCQEIWESMPDQPEDDQPVG